MNRQCYRNSRADSFSTTTPLVSLSQEKETARPDFLETMRKTPSPNCPLCKLIIIKIWITWATG